MINAVLIDDEKPALIELEFLLKKYPEISVTGMYKNPLEAIEKIEFLKPDVVFLDVNMPKLQGTDAASKILDISPDTDIIFVTAFDGYAIEAFELHALDYILKPVDTGRFDKTIERIMKKRCLIKKEDSQRLKIKCLGRFKIGWEGEEPIKWRTEKTKELFMFLITNTGRDISKEELLDRLWGEDDPDKAIKQLYNGIYYIRKTLEAYGIDRSLISIDSNYNLKLGSVYWDIRCFYEIYNDINEKGFEGIKELEALYVGDYLEGEFYHWAELEREKFSKIYEQCVIRLAEYYMEKRQFDKAEEILTRAFNKNPYAENITVLLLRLYRETGNKIHAIRHFNIYSKLIKKELGIRPDEKVKELVIL
ncbi:MAG: response regulator [Clostridia bacterium]|nr:response regulator [Clostridia bacterium]